MSILSTVFMVSLPRNPSNGTPISPILQGHVIFTSASPSLAYTACSGVRSDWHAEMVTDSIALSIYRHGGAISDLHTQNLVKLARRYKRAYEEGNTSTMLNMRTAILAVLADAGLAGWTVRFSDDVELLPPESDDAVVMI